MRSDLIQISWFCCDEVTKDQIRELSQLSLQSVDDRCATQHQPPDCPLVLCPLMSFMFGGGKRRLENWKKVGLNITAQLTARMLSGSRERRYTGNQLKYSFVLF